MFRFTMRELLLLMTLVGMAAGWLTDRVRLTALEKQSAEAAKKADMQTYALETVMRHAGYTTQWEQEGRRVVVGDAEGKGMWDWPADNERPKGP